MDISAAEPVTAVPAPVMRVVENRASRPSRPMPSLPIGLAGTGLTMNGWFAWSLGSSDIAGWLFQSGRSKHWVKVKNRAHPAMERVMDVFG
jgi:hypothetical protein